MTEHGEKTSQASPRHGSAGGAPPSSAHQAHHRAALEEALAWIDAHSAQLEGEEIELRQASGRVLASRVVAMRPTPPADCAAIDGFAVRASDTVGAGDYNPLPLTLCPPGDPLSGGSASPIVAGAQPPPGADAVLACELAEARDGMLAVFATVAEGSGLRRQGQHAAGGSTLAEAGRMLQPQQIGLLAIAGVHNVQVVRRPRVRIVAAAAKQWSPANPDPLRTGRDEARSNVEIYHDADTPMLQALVERDGGAVVETVLLDNGPVAGPHLLNAADVGHPRALRAALTAPGADVILVAGRSGHGSDDEAARVIAECGELVLHGIALRPGGSAGVGVVASALVILLPGDPLDCFCAYEMLAGRLIRQLAGRSPELPYAVEIAEVGRKINSAIGVVELCRVRLDRSRLSATEEAARKPEEPACIAQPVAPVEAGGLASVASADGFLLIPAASEGYGPGAWVRVYVYSGGGAQSQGEV